MPTDVVAHSASRRMRSEPARPRARWQWPGRRPPRRLFESGEEGSAGNAWRYPRCVPVDATTQWIDAGSRAFRGVAMTTTESLLTLAEYLELSLNSGGSVIMMQKCNDVCAMYVGDARRDQDRLRYHGNIAATQAEELLEQTQAGRNRLEIGGQLYRFIRSFKHFEDRGAVVFAPS